MIGERIIVAVCAALLPGISYAQSVVSPHRVRITGRVVDPMGVALPRTAVSLTAAGADVVKSEVLADHGGTFAFDSMLPGAYILRFDAPGFLSRRVLLSKAATEDDVNVGSIMLPIGEITEGPLVPVKKPRKEKPVTVCESLAAEKKFSGETGRNRRPNGMRSQSHGPRLFFCGRPVRTARWDCRFCSAEQGADRGLLGGGECQNLQRLCLRLTKPRF